MMRCVIKRPYKMFVIFDDLTGSSVMQHLSGGFNSSLWRLPAMELPVADASLFSVGQFVDGASAAHAPSGWSLPLPQTPEQRAVLQRLGIFLQTTRPANDSGLHHTQAADFLAAQRPEISAEGAASNLDQYLQNKIVEPKQSMFVEERIYQLGPNKFFSVRKSQFEAGKVEITQYLKELRSPDRFSRLDMQAVLDMITPMFPEHTVFEFQFFIPGYSAKDSIKFMRDASGLKICRLNNSGSQHIFRGRQLMRIIEALGFEACGSTFFLIAKDASQLEFHATCSDGVLYFDLYKGALGENTSVVAQNIIEMVITKSTVLTIAQALAFLPVQSIQFTFQGIIPDVALTRKFATEARLHDAAFYLEKAYRAYLQHHALDYVVLNLFKNLYETLMSQLQASSVVALEFIRSDIDTQPQTVSDAESGPLTALRAIYKSYKSYQREFAGDEIEYMYKALMRIFLDSLSHTQAK